MKQQLESLSRQAMHLITAYADRNDPATIARIAATANKISQMHRQLTEIESQIPLIEQTFALYADHHRKGTSPEVHTEPLQTTPRRGISRKKLKITIDWNRLGKARPTEIICENTSSDTMVKWATRLYEDIGPHRLQQLSEFRINRGPMVSRNPERDFVNKTDGSTYAHQPISDSGYFILTHSSNAEKLTDIPNACLNPLKFPIGAITVEEVDNNAW